MTLTQSNQLQEIYNRITGNLVDISIVNVKYGSILYNASITIEDSLYAVLFMFRSGEVYSGSITSGTAEQLEYKAHTFVSAGKNHTYSNMYVWKNTSGVVFKPNVYGTSDIGYYLITFK